MADEKHDINELRHHLFETIKDLRNPQSKMDVETAKAIKGVADSIIESAKAETKAIELTGGRPSSFLNAPALPAPAAAPPPAVNGSRKT